MINILLMLAVLTVFYILVNGVLALGIRALPSGVFDPNHRAYRLLGWEKRLYRRLGVHCWKNKLPQAGWMTGFSRKHLPQTLDGDYVDRFTKETCMAMLGHFVMAWAGFLSLLFALLPIAENKPVWGSVLAGLAVLHFFMQMAYVMIQRYNLPRFIRLRELMIKNGNR